MSDKKNKDNTEEDSLDLWGFVAKTIKPLKNNLFNEKQLSEKERKKHSAGERQASPPEAAPSDSGGKSAPVMPDPNTQTENSSKELDRRLDERLRRGQVPIDMRVDLHGHTRHEARHILAESLQAAYRSQKRCVLVVTGKGRHTKRQDAASILEPGILKENVPHWLAEPPLAGIVLKHHTARPKDGGSGALYVLLRRKK